MEVKMTYIKKLAAAAFGGAMLMGGAAAPASAQTLDSILQSMRADAAKVQQENSEREARFASRKNERQALLAEARAELAALNRKATSVQSTFEVNKARTEALEEQLNKAQGEFGEVFGTARKKAAEFKSILDSSLITAQKPGRTKVLGKIASSNAIPQQSELEAIYTTMLEEIQAQREIATFEAPVANVENGDLVSVTRVGPFVAFNQNGDYLGYSAPKEDTDIALAYLPSQPKDRQVMKAADAVLNAGDSLVYAPIDPTRGSLLKSFERVPTPVERFGNPFTFKAGHGGFIGIGILWLAIIGVIFGILNIVRIFLTSSAVKAQKRKAQASNSNPLGRIMLAYDDAKNKDAETVELKIDEAILRESPKLERGLNFLKLGAGIAPLLGLLGTVTGMIKTFQAMMIHGTGDPQLMAGGISEALVTTMLGLCAAIPLLILHSFCASMARGVQNTLEEQSAGIVARHVEG